MTIVIKNMENFDVKNVKLCLFLQPFKCAAGRCFLLIPHGPERWRTGGRRDEFFNDAMRLVRFPRADDSVDLPPKTVCHLGLQASPSALIAECNSRW